MKASEQSRQLNRLAQQISQVECNNSNNKRGNNNNNSCVCVCLYSVCNQDSHINCELATAIYIDSLYKPYGNTSDQYCIGIVKYL